MTDKRETAIITDDDLVYIAQLFRERVERGRNPGVAMVDAVDQYRKEIWARRKKEKEAGNISLDEITGHGGL